MGCAALFVLLASCVGGCQTLKEAINPGKWKGVEFAGAGEQYYLVKDIFLTAGSAAHPKDSFDHTMNDTVNLVFIPKNEKNEYTAETRWYDPNDQEYRTIRTTYDAKAEGREGMERKKGGSTRVHSMPTRELVNHKPGMWKVALYLDDKLARRMTFSVR
ncbi:MAG: hypothetical protein HY912_01065 [Desulfomonile tiedjei]|uniref:Uncharacterized protein n=1 Tax=Desulfomonile tiedjei TaxID=2358 RepID=A0A9D6UZM7_9BACT|nr:hypothetical protein [Desulfomonile tiedjei]